MHSTTIELEKITLHDLLTVDTHGEIIFIQDKQSDKPYELISDRSIFFSTNGIFSRVENNSLTIIEPNIKRNISISNLLRDLDESRESCVMLIEGFAGCGKSTLVQYILARQLKTYNYNYSFYNYDLEAQNDIVIHDDEGNIIKKSSIYEAIKKSFFEEFVKELKHNKEIIKDFVSFLKKCKEFQPFNNLYYGFFLTDTFREVLSYVDDDVEKNEDVILKNLIAQANNITSSSCLLALDYIFRLVLYKNRIIEKLYICYDNLDAIENAKDLKNFDEDLVEFRGVIDRYIYLLQADHAFHGLPTPHFVIIATYRKITAIVANIAETAYREVKVDNNAGYNNGRFVFHVDATSAFSYRQIVAKRKKFFDQFLGNQPNISRVKRKEVIEKLSSWNKLNQNLEIMNDRYACLWNKNYRTCSLIAHMLYSESSYDFIKCVDFIDKAKQNDGYYTVADETGNNVLCTYYGNSAILLSCVCKVFNQHHIWDKMLKLSALNDETISYKNVSLSRLILTYIYDKEGAVSLETLYKVFCSKGLFLYEDLCHILANMLARNVDGVWRRPIYYSNDYILSERPEEIKQNLLNDHQKIGGKDSFLHNYSFFLCDSGKAFVERLMQEFEFFSNRIDNECKALYLYNNIDDIVSVVSRVYTAVEHCCNNMLDFRIKYMELYEVSEADYLKLPLHPTTNKHSSQLYTERTIFSHIAYLNNVRRYFLDKSITPDIDRRKQYNKEFVKHIGNYFELYNTIIHPISSARELVAQKLGEKLKDVQQAIDSDSNDLNRLFQSISLP